MQIDLNADLGEGAPHDGALLPLVSSANISCGVHAGDADSIANAIRLAIKHHVSIGAHPSFPDRAHSGRHPMHLSAASLRHHLLYQLHALRGLVLAEGAQITHIKPHGALYNQMADNADLAAQFARVCKEFDPLLPVVGLAGGMLIQEAKKLGLRVLAEGFADRRYTLNGRLVPRSDPRGLIHDTQEAVGQSLLLITQGEVMSVEGERIKMRVDTLCLHGDTPEALTLARALKDALATADVRITSPY